MLADGIVNIGVRVDLAGKDRSVCPLEIRFTAAYDVHVVPFRAAGMALTGHSLG